LDGLLPFDEMRIYVSSTFNDLKEHRAACVRVLRQLGHEVVSMEDYVAESSIPVDKVVADVKSCDVYVVLVAWRYGYVPDKSRVTLEVKEAIKGETSITDYEYLAALEGNVKRLAFLLHERAPWPPHLMDGFAGAGDPRRDLSKVLAFREKLQRDQMVAFFEEPADLEARLSAAVASVGLRSQMLQNSVKLHCCRNTDLRQWADAIRSVSRCHPFAGGCSDRHRNHLVVDAVIHSRGCCRFIDRRSKNCHQRGR